MFRFLLRIFYKLYSSKRSDYFTALFDSIYSSWRKMAIPGAVRSCFIWRYCHLIGGEYIHIGERTIIRHHSVLTAIYQYNNQAFSPSISIGDYCDIGDYANITAINKIEIGNHVLMGRWVTITDNSHGEFSEHDLMIYPSDRDVVSKGSVIIDDDVWICDKVTVCPGVHIGKGSVIAANAVVTKDVPAYSMAAGIPAKVIKKIDKE